MTEDYIEINRKLWNDKVGIHVDSEFYDQQSFLAGKSSLKRPELELLGDITGKKILHLQCHFGQDTMSLSRMGGHATGIDFSEKAIEIANETAQSLNLGTSFVCCDVYHTPAFIDQQFDIVFTSYGTIGWLPDLQKWATVIHKMLKPGGKLIFVEFHPFVFTLDEEFDFVKYFYFNKEEIVETEEGTYAEKNAQISNKSISWNHPISEVLQNLIDAGLTISRFEEYDYSPYACFSKLVKQGEDEYRVEGLEGKLPMVYAIVANKAE